MPKQTSALARIPAALVVPALLASAAALATVPAQAQSLGFTPSAAVVSLGETIELDIVLSDRPAGTPVGFFDIDVVFDPAVLSFAGMTLGDALGDIGLGQAVDASLPPDLAGGVLNLSVLSLLPDLSAQPLSPVLGRVSFSAIGLGDAGLGFGFTAVEDLMGNTLSVTAIDAAVSVVPEPATFWLLGAGVLALGARAARRRC
jgi:hypothetical protein